MKRTIALLLALVMVFALCACGKTTNSAGGDTNDVADGKTYTIKIACENSDNYPATLGLYAMEKYVESHTNGAVQVEVCASGQLGGEEDTLEQVAQGNPEMAVASFAPVVSYVPDFEVMDIPFVYNSYEEAWLVLDSYVGTDLLASMEKYGLKGMAFMENGFRQVTSSQGAIDNMASFKNLKIRTMQNNNHMAFFQAMGANPTPVPFSELYMALSQKIADAQENPIANVTDKKLYEVQDYLSLTNHIYDAMPLVCNLDFFNSLPAAYQAVVTAGAIYGQEVSRFINLEREDLILADLEKQGMKINTVSDDVRAEMAAAAQPAAIDLIGKDIGQEGVDNYLNSVKDILAQIAKY